MERILDRHAEKWAVAPNGCYVWTAALNTTGRPHVGVGKKTALVSRLICEEIYGPPPTSEHQAAHDTPNGCIGKLCVNGRHLRWATQSENQLDIPPDYRSEKARRANARQTAMQRSERQKRANEALTPEQRSEWQRKAAATRLTTTTHEQRSAIARKREESKRKKKE